MIPTIVSAVSWVMIGLTALVVGLIAIAGVVLVVVCAAAVLIDALARPSGRDELLGWTEKAAPPEIEIELRKLERRGRELLQQDGAPWRS